MGLCRAVHGGTGDPWNGDIQAIGDQEAVQASGGGAQAAPWIDHGRIAGFEEVFKKGERISPLVSGVPLQKARGGPFVRSSHLCPLPEQVHYFMADSQGAGPGCFLCGNAFRPLSPYLYLLFRPSPGAGGIAEVATGILLSPVIPGGFLPLFTLLNRMFILFIPAGVGFLTALGTMRDNVLLLTAQNGDKSPEDPSED